MNFTKTLAEYAVNMRYEDLPHEVVEQVKLLTIHVLGVSLAAKMTKQGKDAIALAKAMGGEPEEATIFGDGNKASCSQAAFANGTLADILDWEDCSPTGHPSAGAVPAAMSVGEKMNSSGKDYLTAIVAGYEVYQRIALAVQPTAEYWRKTGWGLTSWQIYAAAVPAAKLLKLDAGEMAQAMGAAATLTPIVSRKINPDSRSNIYHYQHGATCRDGVVAALMAEKGIDGLYDVLDGETGYWVSVSDACDWKWMTKGLGSEYLIMNTLFKYWPANMWIQSYLDCTDALIKEEKIGADDIDEIIVNPSMSEKSSRMIYRPDGYIGAMDAQFSIPYCLASILLDPEPGPNWFAEDRLKNTKILELAGRVRAEGHEVNPYENFRRFQNGDYIEVTVEIITKDGARLGRTTPFPKGHPRNRLSLHEFKERFRRTASFVLPQPKIEQLIEKILNLEEVSDISEITHLIHN